MSLTHLTTIGYEIVTEVLNKIYDDVTVKTCLLMVCLMKKFWKSWIEFVLTNS